MISNNRGVWSSHDESVNNKTNSFSIYENDIIICDFDGPNKKIKFTCNVTSETHELNIK